MTHTPVRGNGTGRTTDATTEPIWLTAQEQTAWRTILYSVSSLLQNLSDVLESDPSIDLSMNEYEILVRLSEAENRRVRMSDLADQIVHSRSRLTHTVARLEKRGLIERVRSSCDRRGREAALTDAGMDLLRRAAPSHVQSVRDLVLDRVGTADFLELGRILAKTVDPDAPGLVPPAR